MSELNPITHEEQQLAAILEGTEPLKPILHEDLFYAALAKGEVPTAKPITRKEMYLKAIAEKGLGGGGTGGGTGGDTSETEQVLIDIIEGNAIDCELPEGITKIGEYRFFRYPSDGKLTIPASVLSIGTSAFMYAQLTELTFKGTPNTIYRDAMDMSSIITINVPWALGAVPSAPWGATNATINYNYKGA